MLKDESFNWPAGNGLAEPPLGTRWIMRSSNGSEWETTGRYTAEQLVNWVCSKPVRPIWNEKVREVA